MTVDLAYPLGVSHDFAGKWPASSYILPEGSTTTSALVDGSLRYVPLWVPESRTAEEFVVETTVAGVGGTPVIRVGLYLPHSSTGKPDALLADLGTIDVTVAPGVLTKAISQVVPRMLVWGAIVAQGATVTQPTVRMFTGMSRFVNQITAGATLVNRNNYVQTGVTGALPSTATPAATTSNAPVFALKSAA